MDNELFSELLTSLGLFLSFIGAIVLVSYNLPLVGDKLVQFRPASQRMLEGLVQLTPSGELTEGESGFDEIFSVMTENMDVNNIGTNFPGSPPPEPEKIIFPDAKSDNNNLFYPNKSDEDSAIFRLNYPCEGNPNKLNIRIDTKTVMDEVHSYIRRDFIRAGAGVIGFGFLCQIIPKVLHSTKATSFGLIVGLLFFIVISLLSLAEIV